MIERDITKVELRESTGISAGTMSIVEILRSDKAKVSDEYGKGTFQILHLFEQLNDHGKARALIALEDLTAIGRYIEKKGELLCLSGYQEQWKSMVNFV